MSRIKFEEQYIELRTSQKIRDEFDISLNEFVSWSTKHNPFTKRSGQLLVSLYSSFISGRISNNGKNDWKNIVYIKLSR